MLEVAKGLALPVEVAGEAIALLAKRGAGKTHTAIVLAEEMLDAGVQIVVLDPVGAWWGLRSKYEIPILGGKHGDVPLEPTAGALIADVVVDSGASLVLQTTDFKTKAEVARFVRDFLDHLYRRLERDPRLIHVFMEEADEFAPQKPFKEETRMLSAVEQVVRRGRSRGLGMTMVTQRSASLNKNVLEQTDILIAMRTTGPNDRKAIEGWVGKQAGGDDHGVIASLPGLENGDAWVWNPERKLLKRIHVRARKTLDVSGRVAPGAAASRDAKLKPIDIAALGGEIRATAERAKENDPAELRKRIRQLEAEANGVAAADAKADFARADAEFERLRGELEAERARPPVEVPVLTDEERGLLAHVAKAIDGLTSQAEVVADMGRELAAKVEARAAPSVAPARPPEPSRQLPPRAPVQRERALTAAPSNGGLRLERASERKVLAALFQHPEGRTRRQTALLSGYAQKGGTFGSALSKLRSMGFVEGSDPLRITEAGMEAAREFAEPLPRGRELLDYWLGQMKRASEREVLLAVVRAWPNSISREDAAVAAEYEAKGGTFGGALSKLRSLELISGSSELRAADELFD